MTIFKQWNTPGEHAIMLEGVVGQLEAVYTVPDTLIAPYIAFLGHPHSLQGGTMNNKVVTTMARTFKELGIPSLRFNFRGVGLSEGSFDNGLGESEDMLQLVKQWQQDYSQSQFIFAGFSFGSYVTYRAASQVPHKLLISIAPPVSRYNYKEFSPRPTPWVIVQGEADEVVPCAEVKQLAQDYEPPLPVIYFSETGHFFHGKLLELKAQLLQCIQSQVFAL